MAQQCLNFLLKQAKKASSGKDRTKLDGAFGYLNELDTYHTLKCSASKPEHFLNLELINEALKVSLTHKLKCLMDKRKASKASKKDFLNLQHGQTMVDIAVSHIKYVSFWFFMGRIRDGTIKC